MKPETLQKAKLAESLPYAKECDYIKVSGNKVFYCDVVGEKPEEECIEFNLKTNPAQREEVLLWLLGRGWSVELDVNRYWFTKFNENQMLLDSHNKDYATALMMAAEKEIG